MYHGVDDVEERDDPQRIITSVGHFEQHVEFLVRRGYRFRTAEELLEQSSDGRPSRGTVVLTFDDGWLDSLTVVLPILSRVGVRATFYVSPALWGVQHQDVPGPPGRLLDAPQARLLPAAGMELGSHTMTHRDLRKLDDEQLAYELEASKREIEQITGRPCRTLAYPYGAFDNRVASAVAEAGYELAFAWQPGPWRPFAAPRLPAPSRYGAGRLALKLAGIRRRQQVGP